MSSPFVYLLVEIYDIDHDGIDRASVLGVFPELQPARDAMAECVAAFRARFTPESVAYAERWRAGLVRTPDRFRDEVKFTLYASTPDSSDGSGYLRGYRIDQFRMHGAPE